MSRHYDYLFKMHLVGDSGVGKTSLLLRFTEDSLHDYCIYTTIGLDFKIKTITLDNKRIKLQIWDIIGHPRVWPYCTSYYRGTSGVILVYSVTDRESFDHVPLWVCEIGKYVSGKVNKLLVGNKCDLVAERAVDYRIAKEYADSLNIPFMETSAKCDVNVEQAFVMMASLIKMDLDNKIQVTLGPLDTLNSVCLDKKAEIKKSRCCC